MTARHYYRNDDGDMEAVDRVLRWSYIAGEKANEGEAGMWEVVVDDPDMTLDFVGHRRWIVYEDESIDDNEVVVDGITQTARWAHSGGDITNPVGRVWIIGIADLNTLWQYRVMTGSDSQFAEQTDVARILQLANSEEMGYFDDLSFVPATNTVTMDETNGRGQTTGQIADQAAQESGKNYWIGSVGDHVSGTDIFLWYDEDGSTAYTSPLALSNDPADLDMHGTDDGTTTTYPLGADTEGTRDYTRQYDGAYGEFKEGAKYISAAENPYAPVITASGRDIAYPAPEIKTRSRMKSRLLRVLRDHATPDETIKTTITLPANRVTQLKRGMRVATKATHGPGYEDFRYMRVLEANPKPVGFKYEVAIVLQGPGSEAPTPPVSCASEGEPAPFGGTWTWDIPYEGVHRQPADSGDLSDILQPSAVGTAEVGASGYPSPGSPIHWYLVVDRGASPSPAAISRMILRVESEWVGDPTLGPTLEASTDGSSWTQIVDRLAWDSSAFGPDDDYNLVIPADWRDARYFRIRSDDLFVTGFWAGFTYDEFFLVECI